jgi:uncharacterized protein
MDKRYITANDLLNDAFELGFRIIDSGYRPGLLLAVWRGGTPVAIAIQELLSYHNLEHHHYAIRTRHYRGIDDRHDRVLVEGLEYALATAGAVNTILIVDDVHDTGLSIAAIIDALESHYGEDCPEIRVATPWFKPGKNRTARTPDYYLHATEQWIVFPHELLGLNSDEIIANKAVVPALRRLKTENP